MTRFGLLWIPVCLLAAADAAGQQPLTLADATARALRTNQAIRIEREGVEAAGARMTAVRGDYDPQLRITIDGGRAEDPITSLFSGAPAGQLAPTVSSFGSSASLSQLFKSGAVVTVSSAASREGTNGAFSLFQPAYLTSLGVDLRQPLLRHRAIDPTRTALRVTALDRDRSSAALSRQVLQTVAEVEQAYWTLAAARRDLEIRRGTLALAEAQRRDTQIRIDARTVAPSDLAQPTAEVERRRGDLFAAQDAVARAERALKQLMLGDAADPLWTQEIAPADAPDVQPASIDLAAALADAERHRPELADIAARLSQDEAELLLARDAMKPRLDLVAGYTMRGLGGRYNDRALSFANLPTTIPPALSGGFGTSWSTLGRQKFSHATFGLSFELPLGRHAARGQLGAVDVRNAASALETAAGRIQAARAGLAAAQIQLRAEQDRFTVGTTTNFFVLTRQNDLALAQLAETAALTDYRHALTALGRATGTLLRDRGISVEQ